LSFFSFLSPQRQKAPIFKINPKNINLNLELYVSGNGCLLIKLNDFQKVYDANTKIVKSNKKKRFIHIASFSNLFKDILLSFNDIRSFIL